MVGLVFFRSLYFSIPSRAVIGSFCIMQFYYISKDREQKPGILLFIGTFIFHLRCVSSYLNLPSKFILNSFPFSWIGFRVVRN